jgi:hypothetical protein
MRKTRQIKTWKELSWEELADLGKLIQRYDGVVKKADRGEVV